MTIIKKRVITGSAVFVALQIVFACGGLNVFTCSPSFYLGYSMFITFSVSALAASFPFNTSKEN